MKSILITGSTDGIGKLAAKKLAREGHQIYIHGRNKEKIEGTIDEIRKESGSMKVFGAQADLSNLKKVKAFAEKTAFQLSKLDVLINNAGVFKTPHPHNIGELDIRFKVNYLAPYVLTREMLPLLKKSANSRIINLSSAAQAAVSTDALQGTISLTQQESYAQSKLALTTWSFDLAKKFKDVSVIAVNPGSLLNTKMVKEAYGNHWSPADKGANILFDLAVSPEFEGESGKYFDNDKGDPRGRFAEAHPDAYSEAKIEGLLKTTELVLSNQNS
ncbi:SDR family NAD(P)-dependent oxidoreductase [Croceivirga thetidis]|uniref:SDR family NAD(P)-dependent oxidoreductase n=1 Tax=Croceivirga thetidis TaxID=2721623 RepID=A0ABX1GRZ5_9FLAO|nr:SDR family NAD(P)-dependent oxidoreductase [Croceivirga thetidis]NKI31810.1 SDR family NAD(P)-dependent oxidoreductase [Croceivirga thetidis]